MTGWQMVAVAVAGFVAGSINAVVGSGTLVTFPALLAVGVPPLTATISSSIGLTAGNVTGVLGYRRELRGQRALLLRLLPASVLGALAGAFLLLHLPATSFDRIVPVLVGLAVVLVLVQPLVRRTLARRRAATGAVAPDQLSIGPGRVAVLLGGAFATGTYGGYFGASQGVLQIGIFGLLLRESLQRLNGLKNVLTLAVNVVSSGAYVVVAADHVNWAAAALIGGPALVGGHLGASLGRQLPAPVLRGAIAVLGIVAIVVLETR